MFFRVVEAIDVDGETRITVAFPSEDQSLKVILQFLQSASEFAHIFRYKSEAILKSHLRVAEWDKEKEKDVAFRKEVYTLYLSLKPMKTPKRFRYIQAYLREKGLSYTYSQVEALITIANKDRRREKENRKLRALVDTSVGSGQNMRLADISSGVGARAGGKGILAISR